MPSFRLKYAQQGLASIEQSMQERLPAVVTNPVDFVEGVADEVSRYPSAAPWGLAGGALGFLAGVPVSRGLWRGGNAFLDSAPGKSLDELVRSLARTSPARLFSKKEFGLPALRPVSKRTAPFLGTALGAGAAYDVGRQRAEEAKYGPPPSNAPYVYIPMQ